MQNLTTEAPFGSLRADSGREKRKFMIPFLIRQLRIDDERMKKTSDERQIPLIRKKRE
jgi:hypothetical protein